MEWNRDQEVKLTGIEKVSCRLDHQTTEVAGKCTTAAILEQEDGLAHRPACLCVAARRQVGFVERRRPRHNKRRLPLSAASAQVVRAFLQGNR
jgi:hypothetical protein